MVASSAFQREAAPGRLDSESHPALSRRSYAQALGATSWEEIWEAGSYYERISELLEDATSYAIFLGWQIDSRLPLPGRDGTRETLKAKLIRLCEEKPDFQVYILMWDHAYFYLLERELMQGRVWDDIHPRVHFIFDNRHPFGASHHEKLSIIDGRTAFCGGIDLCDERWDSPEHLFEDPRRSLDWKSEHHGPYHDLAVQVQGPVCSALQRHAGRRWRQLSSIPFPDPPRARAVGPADSRQKRVYFSRTRASIDLGKRHAITREIEFLFRELILGAEKQLVFEGQYYWSREVNDLLIAKMRERQARGVPFTVVLVLAELRGIKSLTRYMARYEFKLLRQLEQAARATGTRLILGSPYSFPPEGAPPGTRPKAVYIHSKVLIVDDRYLSLGSANFASRALRIDSEVNLTLEGRTESERAHIRDFTDRVFRHWSIGPYERAPSHVRLRKLEDFSLFIGRRSLLSELLIRIPWEKLFDPEQPWSYPIKRRLRLLGRRRPGWLLALTAAVWFLGVALSLGVASQLTSMTATAWPWIYATLLASAWLVPVPFSLVAGLASLHLGGDAGPALAVATAWVGSGLGYGLTRVFPSAANRYFGASGPLWLPERIGLRSFPVLVSILFDPRLSFRTKIAFQGLYSVPLPWFLLGTWVILASLLYTLCHWGQRLLQAPLAGTVASLAPYAVGASALWAATGLALALHRLRKPTHGKKTPTRPLLQHP